MGVGKGTRMSFLFAETGQVLPQGSRAFSASSVRKVTDTTFLERGSQKWRSNKAFLGTQVAVASRGGVGVPRARLQSRQVPRAPR